MINDHNEDILNTYRYLRLGMASLAALLGTAIGWQIFLTGPKTCLQTSISAYYYTPVRAVFVACLCAIGTALIVYKGNTRTEDVLLNFTGITAFVVAFVPTGVDRTCEASNIPTDTDLAAAVRNNGWALLVVGVLTVVVARTVNPSQFQFGSWTRLERLWLILTCLALMAAAGWFLLDGDSFRRHGHAFAASALFLGIVLTTGANAISYARSDTTDPTVRNYANRYAYVAITMLVSVAVAAALYLADWSYWLFFLEASVLLEFAALWAVQTQELWDAVKRDGAVNAAPAQPPGQAATTGAENRSPGWSG